MTEVPELCYWRRIIEKFGSGVSKEMEIESQLCFDDGKIIFWTHESEFSARRATRLRKATKKNCRSTMSQLHMLPSFARVKDFMFHDFFSNLLQINALWCHRILGICVV
jgi:hypothetical protein